MDRDSTDWPVAIGRAARRSGVSAKMIRHYEALGLLAPVGRTESGYRQYGANDIHTLRFIKRARDLGFSMQDIASLVNLWHDRQRASGHVKQIADKHLQHLRHRIEQLQSMERTLLVLTQGCHGNDRPDCPILEDLAQDAPLTHFTHASHSPHEADKPRGHTENLSTPQGKDLK